MFFKKLITPSLRSFCVIEKRIFGCLEKIYSLYRHFTHFWLKHDSSVFHYFFSSDSQFSAVLWIYASAMSIEYGKRAFNANRMSIKNRKEFFTDISTNNLEPSSWNSLFEGAKEFRPRSHENRSELKPF